MLTAEENAELGNKLQQKQYVVPPDLPKVDYERLSQEERSLFEKGWEREVQSNGVPVYYDPKGSRLPGEYQDAVTIPNPNRADEVNRTIVIRQFVVPPATYSFTLWEALDIQRRRDLSGDDGPTPLTRLAECEKRCGETERELGRLRGKIDSILSGRNLSTEGIKAALRELVGKV